MAERTVGSAPSPQRLAQKLSTPPVDPAGPDAPLYYDFDRFRVDVRRRRLLHDGALVPIKPKALETLLVLIERRGRVVEKDELMSRLWPDTVVEEANLTQNIFVVRKALGEVPGEQRFIATVARRGYRFVADVREPGLEHGDGPIGESVAETAAPAGQRQTRRWRAGVSRAALGAAFVSVLLAMWTPGGRRLVLDGGSASIDAVAVLPFRSLSPGAESEYFAEGMTDAVITDLSAISALRVTSRQSSMHYRYSRKLLPDIARELGVDAVVEGTVARDGSRLRLTARLVSASNDTTLWTDTYDRQISDALKLQGELARSIADAVRVTVTSEERARLAARRQVDPTAYELYLRGRYFWGLRREDALRKSLDSYLQSLERDPGFAPAHAGLALTYTSLGALGYMPGAEAGPRMQAAALQSVALDPLLVDGHVALAAFKVLYDWNWPAGERAWRRILARSPHHPTARLWYGFLLDRLGRHEEALAERERALLADPLSPTANASLAAVLRHLGRVDDAMERYRRTLDLAPGLNAATRVELALLLLEQQRHREAVEMADAAAIDAAGDPRVSAPVGHLFGLLGRRDGARRVVAELAQMSGTRYVPPVWLAYVHAGLGERDAAFAELDRAFAERSPMLAGITVDHMLEPLHDDARFADLLRRIEDARR
jgi:TolB-like protein/DNA-binding winged helix-turn-helix (wHTH) protein